MIKRPRQPAGHAPPPLSPLHWRRPQLEAPRVLAIVVAPVVHPYGAAAHDHHLPWQVIVGVKRGHLLHARRVEVESQPARLAQRAARVELQLHHPRARAAEHLEALGGLARVGAFDLARAGCRMREEADALGREERGE